MRIRTRIRIKTKSRVTEQIKAQVDQESRVESRLGFLGDQAGRTCGSSRLFHDLEVSATTEGGRVEIFEKAHF